MRRATEPLLDRGLMLSCLALSSSEAVRLAAAAWLEAYDAACAAGATPQVAERRAAAAWDAARRPTSPEPAQSYASG